MNSHIQRLKIQEEMNLKQRKKNIQLSRIIIALSLLCFSLISMVGVMMSINPNEISNTNEVGKTAQTVVEKVTEEDKWMLVLVNRDNLVPVDFTVDLIRFENTRIDYRIADELEQMIEDAKKEGINLIVYSGYRSVSQQKELYDKKVISYVAKGYGEEASKANANQYIQPPGASEHHTGLAIDFGTDGSGLLDESFADTPAYNWLKENAAKYGFIERYPKDKSKITGVTWEPWHFRYVGAENAKAITLMGICLEEYV